MKYKVHLHKDVVKYLKSLDKEKKTCYQHIKNCLEKNPKKKRSKCDIKKLKGKDKSAYRLRVGSHRFIYIVKDKKVLVVEAFKRGRGYR